MTLAELVDLLRGLAAVPSEDVAGLSELDHGLQCAHELSLRRPADVELQVAGLVHDIGHQFGSDDRHAELGAEAVRALFGDRIADLVAAHVTAKRYLVAAEPVYRAALSPGSIATLALEGGPMAPGLLGAFESSPHFADAVELRRADDAAKVPGRPVPTLEFWAGVLGSLRS